MRPHLTASFFLPAVVHNGAGRRFACVVQQGGPSHDRGGRGPEHGLHRMLEGVEIVEARLLQTHQCCDLGQHDRQCATLLEELQPPVGVFGDDPRTEATIEIGRKGCDLIVEGMVRKARDLIAKAK